METKVELKSQGDGEGLEGEGGGGAVGLTDWGRDSGREDHYGTGGT